eukprot:12230646-Alexandrium_andersonii.AAC.1
MALRGLQACAEHPSSCGHDPLQQPGAELGEAVRMLTDSLRPPPPERSPAILLQETEEAIDRNYM